VILRHSFLSVASLLKFLRHTQLYEHKPGKTPLNEWSVRNKGRYLHNTHKTRTSMPSAGFEPAIPAIKQLQTHALDRTAAGIVPQLSNITEVSATHELAYKYVRLAASYFLPQTFV